MWGDEDLINAGVVSLVGLGCSREVEGGRVIDSWEGVVQGGVEADEGEVEGSSLMSQIKTGFYSEQN